MKKLLMAGAFGLLLAGCGMAEESSGNASAEGQGVQELEVEVLTEPAGEVGEWTLEAYVSQGGKAVNDADEVTFEVFAAGKKDSGVKTDYTELKDGVYSVKHRFDEDGVYYFISHVTARGLHTMPTQQVIVGTVSDEEIQDAEAAMAKGAQEQGSGMESMEHDEKHSGH